MLVEGEIACGEVCEQSDGACTRAEITSGGCNGSLTPIYCEDAGGTPKICTCSP
jgi:hypothetical protein